MAVCNWCFKEMTDPAVITCKGNTQVRFTTFISKPSVPFKAATEEWLVNWFNELPDQSFSGEPKPDFEGWYKDHILSGNYLRCHDCKVTDGGVHHPGCGMERCPLCGGQLISCGCIGIE